MRIFDATTETLERALDVRLARHNVLAGNLANVDTPGFVPRDLDFRAAMSGAEDSGAPGPSPEAAPGPDELPLNLASYAPALPAGAMGLSGLPAPSAAATNSPGIDGNAVDADRALVAIAENAVQYGAAARAVSKKLAILRYVASDGTA